MLDHSSLDPSTLDKQIKQLQNQIIELKSIAVTLPSPLKLCVKCNKEKSLLLFTKSIASKDGRTNSCKECASKEAKARNIVLRYGRL